MGQHFWVAAATVQLSDSEAKLAQLRGSVRLAERIKINCLEIYCSACRRPWDDVFDEPCTVDVELLKGGPIGVRKKRRHNHDCQLLGCAPPASQSEDEETA